MRDYRCRRCEYTFCSENEIPYCPACECESLDKLEDEFNIIKEDIVLEEHHIHPKFMDNPKGLGQQFRITKKQHSIIHGKIMNWVWENIREEDKEKTINYVINKSKEFIGVKDDTETA